MQKTASLGGDLVAEGVDGDVLVALVREEPLPAGAVGRLGGVLRHERVEVGLGPPRVWHRRLGTLYLQETSEGAFSVVSRPIFASPYSFWSIFRDLYV